MVPNFETEEEKLQRRLAKEARRAENSRKWQESREIADAAAAGVTMEQTEPTETPLSPEEYRLYLARIVRSGQARHGDVLKAIEMDAKMTGKFGNIGVKEEATASTIPQPGSADWSRLLNAALQAEQQKARTTT